MQAKPPDELFQRLNKAMDSRHYLVTHKQQHLQEMTFEQVERFSMAILSRLQIRVLWAGDWPPDLTRSVSQHIGQIMNDGIKRAMCLYCRRYVTCRH